MALVRALSVTKALLSFWQEGQKHLFWPWFLWLPGSWPGVHERPGSDSVAKSPSPSPLCVPSRRLSLVCKMCVSRILCILSPMDSACNPTCSLVPAFEVCEGPCQGLPAPRPSLCSWWPCVPLPVASGHRSGLFVLQVSFFEGFGFLGFFLFSSILQGFLWDFCSFFPLLLATFHRSSFAWNRGSAGTYLGLLSATTALNTIRRY